MGFININIKHLTIRVISFNCKHRYGTTEAGCVGSLTRVSDLEKSEKFAFETIGQGFPFVEAKIIDPNTNKIIPRNSDGNQL